MNLQNIKSILPLGAISRRAPLWYDMRQRSPKALGDWSGVSAPRLAPSSAAGLQELDYEQLARVFVCNDLIWTCISYVSRTIALAKLQVERKDGNAYVPDHTHGFAKALAFPNEDMTEFDFWESWTTHMLLYGRFGCLLIRERTLELRQNGMSALDALAIGLMDDKSPIVGFMPIHPSILDTRFSTSEHGWTGFMYEPYPGIQLPVHANNVLKDVFYNPAFSRAGVSPTWIALRWLRLDTAMNQQLFQYFENGAIPSMIISMKRPPTGWTGGGDTAHNLLKGMKQSWLDRFAKQGSEPKTPAFLYGDITVDRIEEKIDEMSSKGLFYEITNRICQLMGAPAELFEVGFRYSSQRATAEQSQKNYFNNTVQPHLVRRKQKLTNLVLPSYGLGIRDVRLNWDYSDMTLAAFIEKDRRADVYKQWELGLTTRGQSRIALGMPPLGTEEDDDLYRLTVMSDMQNANAHNNGPTRQQSDNRLIPAEEFEV